MNQTTDPERRLAQQIAIQLPESVAAAHRVLDLATELLDDWMIAPQSDAHRRARLLGWGMAQPASGDRPRWRGADIAWIALWDLSALSIATVVGLLMVESFGAGAGTTYMIGVTVVALILGMLPALGFSFGAMLLGNLLIVPPMLEFSRPTTVELIAWACYLVLAVLVPWLAPRRQQIRVAALGVPAAAEEKTRDRIAAL